MPHWQIKYQLFITFEEIHPPSSPDNPSVKQKSVKVKQRFCYVNIILINGVNSRYYTGNGFFALAVQKL